MTPATPKDGEAAVDILLVEDDPDDAEITCESIAAAPLVSRVSVVEDGVEAIDFLRRRGRYRDAPRPDLIILDLNLPRKDGHEVLEEIKSDPDLSTIPVTVFTTSDAPEDIRRAYRRHANCYVRKPLGVVRFMEVVKQVETFWIDLAERPERE